MALGKPLKPSGCQFPMCGVEKLREGKEGVPGVLDGDLESVFKSVVIQKSLRPCPVPDSGGTISRAHV